MVIGKCRGALYPQFSIINIISERPGAVHLIIREADCVVTNDLSKKCLLATLNVFLGAKYLSQKDCAPKRERCPYKVIKQIVRNEGLACWLVATDKLQEC